jgi:hypothetical protein
MERQKTKTRRELCLDGRLERVYLGPEYWSAKTCRLLKIWPYLL